MDKKVWDRLTPEEIKEAADALSGLVIDSNKSIISKELREHMLDFIADARENFVCRAEYPMLLKQCRGCKYMRYIYGDNWTCDLGHIVLHCDHYEKSEPVEYMYSGSVCSGSQTSVKAECSTNASVWVGGSK